MGAVNSVSINSKLRLDLFSVKAWKIRLLFEQLCQPRCVMLVSINRFSCLVFPPHPAEKWRKLSVCKYRLILTSCYGTFWNRIYCFVFPGAPMFTKKHRRSPSHYNLKYGSENSPPDSPVKETVHITCEIESKEGLEVRFSY